jgi:hypothetical protein
MDGSFATAAPEPDQLGRAKALATSGRRVVSQTCPACARRTAATCSAAAASRPSPTSSPRTTTPLVEVASSSASAAARAAVVVDPWLLSVSSPASSRSMAGWIARSSADRDPSSGRKRTSFAVGGTSARCRASPLLGGLHQRSRRSRCQLTADRRQRPPHVQGCGMPPTRRQRPAR